MTNATIAVDNGVNVEALLGAREALTASIAAIASVRCFFTKILDALGSEADAGLMQKNPKLSQRFLG